MQSLACKNAREIQGDRTIEEEQLLVVIKY
jgi:hypothetical protein